MVFSRNYLTKLFLCVILLICFTYISVAEGAFLRSLKQSRILDRTFDKVGIRNDRFEFSEAVKGRQHVTNLDTWWRWLTILIRRVTLAQYKMDEDEVQRHSYIEGKVQTPVPLNQPFPCNTTNGRSPTPPTSVHRLRPGDIDVIAVLGDSLSAGNGVISSRVVHTLNEYRGVSFSGGGTETWRTVLTLPNILKVFNPHLYGYSTGNSLTVEKHSKLNLAEPMLMSRDLPFQAQVIIDRMKQDPNIDMKNHWKLLTLFIGNNDICSDMCHHDTVEEFLYDHDRDIRRTLSLLRDNVPRLLVNLVPVPNMVTTLHPMKGIPVYCSIIHRIGCHCVFSDKIDEKKLQEISSDIARWQQVEEHIASLSEYNTNDFAVVYQPISSNVTMPVLRNGATDMRYWSTDCFHFSQLGHAALANGLWNNMMQSKNEKQRDFSAAFERFRCPTETHPYIRTLRNS